MRKRTRLLLAVTAGMGIAGLVGCTPVGGGAGACPADSTTFEKMNQATYAVVLKVRTGQGVDDFGFSTLGTAFAVGDRLLATNAHITEFFNGLTGLEVEEVLAVQSGTGTVVTLLRALTHPDYTGSPLSSPDLGLFTTLEILPVTLPIASESELEGLLLGDGVQLVGFPGDVNDIIAIIPNQTVPQATSLSGQITAFRNHDPTVAVTTMNRDVIQHQAPTTPGSSGSAMVHCGKVIAANNAGTVQIVLVVGADGSVMQDRTAAAANNFGVHAKYLEELISLFEAQSLQGFELPPPFVPGGGGGGGGGQGVEAFAGAYSGGVTTPTTAVHQFTITITQNGDVAGSSSWQTTGVFNLTGAVNAQGQVQFMDDAQQRLGFNTGVYVGTIDADTGQASGTYSEGTADNVLANWTATR